MLSKFSLKLKVAMLSAAIVLFALVLILKHLMTIADFNHFVVDRIDNISRQGKIVRAVDSAYIHFKIQIQQWQNILIRGNDQSQFEEYLKQFKTEETTVQEFLGRAITLSESAGMDSKELIELKNEHSRLGQAYRKGLYSFNRNDELTGKKVDKLVTGMSHVANESIAKLTDLQANIFSSLVSNTTTEVSRYYDAARSISISVMAVAIVIIGIIICWMFFDLFRVLGGDPAYTAKVVKQVADGHLEVDINVRKGDTSSLLAEVNHMKNSLSEIIIDVKDTADSLSSASQEMNAMARSMAKGVSEQLGDTEGMSAPAYRNNENTVAIGGKKPKLSAVKNSSVKNSSAKNKVRAVDEAADVV